MSRPLTAEELRAAIYCRAKVAIGAGSHLNNHVTGQIRGLLFALLGDPPPTFDSTSVMLDLAGIPYSVKDDGSLEIPEDWMVAHGFDAEGRHPRFSKPW